MIDETRNAIPYSANSNQGNILINADLTEQTGEIDYSYGELVKLIDDGANVSIVAKNGTTRYIIKLWILAFNDDSSEYQAVFGGYDSEITLFAANTTDKLQWDFSLI